MLDVYRGDVSDFIVKMKKEKEKRDRARSCLIRTAR